MSNPLPPRGHWCRGCGQYLSRRTRIESARADAHTAAHVAAGHPTLDGRPWRRAA